MSLPASNSQIASHWLRIKSGLFIMAPKVYLLLLPPTIPQPMCRWGCSHRQTKASRQKVTGVCSKKLLVQLLRGCESAPVAVTTAPKGTEMGLSSGEVRTECSERATVWKVITSLVWAEETAHMEPPWQEGVTCLVSHWKVTAAMAWNEARKIGMGPTT